MKNKIANIALAGFISFNLFGPRTDVRTDLKDKAEASGTPKVRETLETKVEDGIGKRIENFLNKRGHIVKGTVTGKDATFLTVDSDGKSIKVNITDKTQFRRLFWGKSSLGEIVIGDKVDIVGRWANEGKTEINAVLIRDLSLMKRFGAFFGEVKSLTSGGFVITTIHRDDQKVTIGTAKLVNRKEETITQGDIKVGDKIRVKGLWDATSKTVTEVTQVKDFSLPTRTD